MKKYWTLMLVVAILFCLAGCGGAPAEGNGTTTTVGGQADVDSGNVADAPTENTQPQATEGAKCISCEQYAKSGSPYCSYCGCWEMDCPMPHKNGANYCVSHACLLCSNPNYGNTYCSQHRCDRCDNVVVEGSRYCVAHKCLLCDNQVFGNSSYCSQHG